MGVEAVKVQPGPGTPEQELTQQLAQGRRLQAAGASSEPQGSTWGPGALTCFSTLPSRPIMLGSSGSSASAGPLARSLSVMAGPRPTIWSTLPGRDSPLCELGWVWLGPALFSRPSLSPRGSRYQGADSSSHLLQHPGVPFPVPICSAQGPAP